MASTSEYGPVLTSETTLSKKSITFKTPTSSDGIQVGYRKNVNNKNGPLQSTFEANHLSSYNFHIMLMLIVTDLKS